MKKLLSIVLALLVLSTFAFAEDTIENDGTSVEIEFCVGDATLVINGQEVTVEKPYVVGEGVTLVPVRVITEAFGAEVGWEAATKTITLTYPDVNIVLQIGNPIAEVNGRAETLLSAPELTSNGFTMVPLRFISENFGAEVGYDNATKRITVVKTTVEQGTTVEGAIQDKYVGDSYYGWSMENPKDMYLDDRSFDGFETYFIDDLGNWIDVYVSPKSEDYDFEDDFADFKGSLQGLTLVKADKDTSNESKMTMRFQAKNKELFLDSYVIVTEQYLYVVNAGMGLEDTKLKDTYTAIVSSFDVVFKTEETYDLSNVENGVRSFEVESMKFSIKIPQNFTMISGQDSENAFTFVSTDENDTESRVNVEIFSKDGVGTAQELAQNDHDRNMKYLNEEITTFFDVTEKKYDNFNAFEYSYEVDAYSGFVLHRDVFFELGEYVYNVHVSFMLDKEEAEKKIDEVLSSIVAEEVDFEEVGTIMRNNDEREGTKEVDALNKCTLEIPKTFTEVTASPETIMYLSESGIFVALVISDDEYTRDSFRYFVEQYEKSQSKKEGATVIQSARRESINGKYFDVMIIKSEDEESGAMYCVDYMILNDGSIYIFEALYDEKSYSEFARQQITDIISSVEFE